MAQNQVFISLPPDEVFDLLSDARAYAKWVVGSHEVRAADERWPAPGSAFDHTIGKPPLRIKDRTEVVQALAPTRLRLLAKARPLPSAEVTLDLQPEHGGTRVTMVEEIANPLLNRLAGPLTHTAIRLRNRESLRRLKALAEGNATRPGGTLPTRHRG
jgi:uncharacterized protein YndB with AHSA1/START domain